MITFNRYHFDEILSPTFYNLEKNLRDKNWRRSLFKSFSHVTSDNFEFHKKAAETLEFKHLLLDLVANCSPGVMPNSHYIDDDNYPFVLSHISDRTIPWILKPSLLNNGQHIKIFRNPQEILQHYRNTNRMGGAHVLQEYIDEPHLLRGHKYSIRMFVVVTNFMGVYLYEKGYYNVAVKPYSKLSGLSGLSGLTV